MSTQFLLPDLGEGLTEAEIVAWHVNVGDHVVVDQPLVSVETEKAVVEVPSPQSGTVTSLFATPGDIVKVGAPLVEFNGESVDTGTVVGVLPEVPNGREPVPVGESHDPAHERSGTIRLAPAVRKRARDLGVNLTTVRGSGPEGAITMTDIEGAANASTTESAWRPLRGLRRAMAIQMTRAGGSIVPATLTDEADVDSWPADADPSVRLVRAVAAACSAVPSLNAWYDSQADTRLLHGELRLGLAVDMSDGLIVPVIPIGEDDSDETLMTRLRQLINTARQRRSTPSDLSGATFTLSNFGTLGGRHGALIVVPPQVAILGAGRIDQRVVAVDGKPAVHKLLPLSLTFDHRAVTGGEAARFMREAITALQSSDPPTASGDEAA